MTQAISPGNSSGFCGDGDDKNPSAANGQVGNWQTKAQLFDYRQAANPVRSGLTTPIDLYQWDPAIHATGPTSILPLDRSASLGCVGAHGVCESGVAAERALCVSGAKRAALSSLRLCVFCAPSRSAFGVQQVGIDDQGTHHQQARPGAPHRAAGESSALLCCC
jgi:hypothetical protein